MRNTGKLEEIHSILSRVYGPQKCPLRHNSPFQLLVAVILSAQCTDKKVNAVLPYLFGKYPDAKSMAKAEITDVENIIRTVGLFHAKSRNILAAASALESQFASKVPSNMEDLTSLPGVGRKSANVILGDAFGLPGFPVDTHVIRLLNRIGAVNTPYPEKIEADITKKLPEKQWLPLAHLLKAHGRNRCKALSPDCEKCEIRRLCAKKGIPEIHRSKSIRSSK